jgi:MerR family copper efflux transcriptional regulator
VDIKLPEESAMYIGEVARLTGASLKAIRHYEALGLLGAVPRAGVYRIFAANDLLLIQLIKQAQALGFRLSELAPLLGERSGKLDWQRILAAMHAKQLSVKAEVERLEVLQGRLQLVAAEIPACLTGTVEAQSPGKPCIAEPLSTH